MIKIIENMKRLVEKFKSLSKEDLQTYKYLLCFLIVVDLFGLYWYLKLKSLALAFLLVFMVALALVSINERRYHKMDDEKEKEIKELEEKLKKLKEGKESKEKEQKKDDEDKDDEPEGFGIDLGIDPDEYNKRMEKALGKI